MATREPQPRLRDRQLLWCLYLTPLTINQALRWSQCWPVPFTQWKKLYDRLEEFRKPKIGWVR